MMRNDSLGIVPTQYPTFAESPAAMHFQSGRTIDPITLVYTIYGKPNTARSNSIPVCHALPGYAHTARASDDDKAPGRWQEVPVLDLGCGGGGLLVSLKQQKNTSARNVEPGENRRHSFVGRGLTVLQGNIESGLVALYRQKKSEIE